MFTALIKKMVFDLNVMYDDDSLNDVLLMGPDLNSSLLSVLAHFRKEPVVLTADIQKMFYCFLVKEDHQNYLRFFCYK